MKIPQTNTSVRPRIIMASKVAHPAGPALVVGISRTIPPEYTIILLATGERIDRQIEGEHGIRLIDMIPRDDDDEIPHNYREWTKSRPAV